MSTKPQKNGNFDRIAVLFFLCYDERREGTGGMSALLDDDRQVKRQIGICQMLEYVACCNGWYRSTVTAKGGFRS